MVPSWIRFCYATMGTPAAPILPIAWELLYAIGGALKIFRSIYSDYLFFNLMCLFLAASSAFGSFGIRDQTLTTAVTRATAVKTSDP